MVSYPPVVSVQKGYLLREKHILLVLSHSKYEIYQEVGS